MRGSMLSSRSMARRPRPTHCPACDAPLHGTAESVRERSEPTRSSAVDLTTDAPSCPKCEQRLFPVRVAGVFRRCGGAAVDGAILFVTAGGLNWALLGMLGVEGPLRGAAGLEALLRLLELDAATLFLHYTPLIGMSGFYFGLFWSLTGRTPGQRLVGIRVVDERGRPPHPIRAGVRVLGLGLGLLPCALGWLWAAFDLERRAWHDHFSQTYVVKDATSRAIVHHEPNRDPVVHPEVVRDA
jgi:uncharacterized RDD family membrane protein YckC